MRDLQAYMRGEAVDQNGFPSRLRWLDRVDVTKVPVDMVGSGPRSLALAASLADRVTLAVGADLERLAWGLDTVRCGAEAAGRDAASIPVGAYINVGVGNDRRKLLETVRGMVATFAHFSAGAGTDFSRQPEIMRRVTTAVADGIRHRASHPGRYRPRAIAGPGLHGLVRRHRNRGTGHRTPHPYRGTRPKPHLLGGQRRSGHAGGAGAGSAADASKAVTRTKGVGQRRVLLPPFPASVEYSRHRHGKVRQTQRAGLLSPTEDPVLRVLAIGETKYGQSFVDGIDNPILRNLGLQSVIGALLHQVCEPGCPG